MGITAAFTLFIIVGILFLLVMIRDKRTIMTGILFVLSLVALFVTLQQLSFKYSNTINALLPFAGTVRGISNFIMAIIGLLPTIMILISVWYGVMVIRREGLQSQNARTLGFGLVLMAYTFLWPLLGGRLGQNIFTSITYALVSGIVVYFIMLKSMYTATSIINLMHRKGGKDLDYLILMGAGMKGDRAEGLMEKRVEKVYELYLLNPGAKVVVTGGWKDDPDIPKTEQVVEMLKEKGIPEDRLLVDEASVNTRDDIVASRRLIEEDLDKISVKEENYEGLSKRGQKRREKKDKKSSILNSKEGPKIAVVSSNYHVLRSLIIARKEKIKCIGYGAPVRIDYRMNAFVNEYYNYVKVSKKTHIVLMSILFCFYLMIVILLIINYDKIPSKYH